MSNMEAGQKEQDNYVKRAPDNFDDDDDDDIGDIEEGGKRDVRGNYAT